MDVRDNLNIRLNATKRIWKVHKVEVVNEDGALQKKLYKKKFLG